MNETENSKWMSQPDGPGYWWYFGDRENEGVVENFVLRGIYRLEYRDLSNGATELHVNGLRVSIYSGLWRRVESPELPFCLSNQGEKK